MIEVLPEFGRWVQPIYGLANIPFEPHAFRTACEAIAPYEESSDDTQWRFEVAQDFSLLVAVNTMATGKHKASGWPLYRPVRVLCALLSVGWWETYLKSQHPTRTSWDVERQQFDRLYVGAHEQAERLLGPPVLEGIDEGEIPHRWALWRGRTGLFIVQQSAYDPQFGLDVNYWVTPWTGPDPQPTSPFIDWLTYEQPKGDGTMDGTNL